MGYNSTLLIHNDSLEAIRRDLPGWWQQVEHHIQEHAWAGRRLEQRASNHANVSQVVTVHHADFHSLIIAGGGYASVVGRYWVGNQGHHRPEDQLALLQRAADSFGYRLEPR